MMLRFGKPTLHMRVMAVVALALLPLEGMLGYALLQAGPSAGFLGMGLLPLALAVTLGLAWWACSYVLRGEHFRRAGSTEAGRTAHTAYAPYAPFDGVEEGFLRAQQDVLSLMAGGASLAHSLSAIVLLIEKGSPGSLCSIMLRAGSHLGGGAAPSLPAEFTQAVDGLPTGEGVGACGTAAFRKEQVLVADVQTDPLMDNYRDLLAAHGLAACWSTPVLSAAGEVLATFAVYRRTPGLPTVRDLQSIATATRLAGIAIERHQADEALVNSESRFRELAEKIEEVFYIRDGRSGRVLYVSPGYETIWGRSLDSLYADPASHMDAVLPDDQSILVEADRQNRSGRVSDVQYRIALPDGQTRWIRDHAYPVLDSSGKLERVLGTAHDITERALAEKALVSTNRALELLSRSSIALTRMPDEESLLAEICRIAVEVGNYRMAWVGYAQPDDHRSIRVMARAGQGIPYLDAIRLSWSAATPLGQGPAGQVIRSGQPQQSGDISRGDNHFYWHETALEHGFKSALFLPLRDRELAASAEGRPDDPPNLGVLCLYGAEVQTFSPEEIQLLQELADNLAVGVGALRAKLERRRSMDAARLAAAQVREQASLLDRAQDAIMVHGLDMRIRYWNQGAQRLYGWSADEVLGLSMAEQMYPDPGALQAAMTQVLASNGDWTGELEQSDREGSKVVVQARWTLVRDEHGKVDGILGINTDIRERRRWRDEILRLNASLESRVKERTAQLEFANEQLEAFSYSVSHDLRTPLSSVDGFSTLLEKSLAGGYADGDETVAQRRRHCLMRIRHGVLQMGEMIDALLALADVSRSRLRWEPVDLSSLAATLLSLYQESEPGRKVELTVQPGLRAEGDPRLLNLVLDNLLGNAWKFSAGKPVTHIAFGEALQPAQPLSDQDAMAERVYVVRDKGAGFDMAYADKLFGAFQRLHSQTEFKGTGIGLTTVQRIVARHGGRVWAESVPGEGARFYFTLGADRL